MGRPEILAGHSSYTRDIDNVEHAAAGRAVRPAAVRTLDELAELLRSLRRRHARRAGAAPLSYRELAAATGWSHGIVGEYLAGRVLPPTDRFDTLVRLLGATPAEQGALATARDRVEELRRVRPAGPPVPRQLPAEPPGFTGRAGDLAVLDELLLLGDRAGSAVVAVSGTGGVGKTALALRWAHRAADRFPDGQLYVDLRGYSRDRPRPAEDALGALLRSLGVAPAAVPPGLDERAAAYRSLLAGRRMLVLLDNAHAAAQVRPLLPGAAGCAVLVTSRDRLAGLVARDGAQRLDLDVLAEADAFALLRTLLGARVDDAPDAARQLAGCCAGLPLALRVAAESAGARPGIGLADVAADLAGLDAFEVPGDPDTAVRAVLSWSVRHLAAPVARAFTLLGLFPGRTVDAWVLATLGGGAAPGARSALRELACAHLIEPSAAGYAMHDLLRAYAGELALAGLAAADRQAALDRLYAHHLHAVAAAMDLLFPHERHARPEVATAGLPARFPADAAAAREWLDHRRADLVRLALHAAGHDRAAVCADLSSLLWRYFEVGGHHEQALAVHAAALAALPTGAADRPAVLANLGNVHWWLGAYEQARDEFEQAVAGFAALGDAAGQARALSRLAAVHERLGAYPRASACLGEALALCRAVGDRHGEAAQLLNRGSLHRRQGRHAHAAAHQRRAAAIFAALGDLRLEGYALGNLGVTYEQLGRFDDALAQLERARAACVAAGDPAGQGSALAALGSVCRRTGAHDLALAHLGQALSIGRQTGDRALETEAGNGLGETLLALGRADEARERHQGALALAEAAGDRFEQARALEGIGHALAAAGRHHGRSDGLPREHWRRALGLYTELGVPEADRLRPLV